jgi:hypothetical protein
MSHLPLVREAACGVACHENGPQAFYECLGFPATGKYIQDEVVACSQRLWP